MASSMEAATLEEELQAAKASIDEVNTQLSELEGMKDPIPDIARIR